MHPQSSPPSTALDAARALAQDATTVAELVGEALARIAADRDRPDPIDAWATLLPHSQLRARASALDAARRAGAKLGPLAGIPMGVKDLLDTADLPTEAGSARWRGRRPGVDAAVVAAVRAVDGLMLGKTRTHEFAAGVTTPPTGNPFDTSRIPGGSSGGSAAAVAAAECFWAVGTDTLGSVRMPAALCGVVGLKPTLGSISLAGVAPLSPTLDHVGVFARDCADAAAAFEALAGPTAGHGADFPGSRPLRIGFLDDLEGEIEPGVQRLHHQALEQLQSATSGRLRPARLPAMTDYVAIGFDVLAAEAARWHQPMLEQPAAPDDDYRPDVRALLAHGRRMAPERYECAREQLRAARADSRMLFDQLDVLVTPTVGFVAPSRNETTYRWPTGREEQLGTAMPRFTAFGNVTGLPAVSVPVGLSDGLPVGVQLIARPNAEHFLLRVAALITARIAPERGPNANAHSRE